MFVYLPLVVVLALSFNSSHSGTLIPFTGITLQWYRDFLGNSGFVRALRNSLLVGLVTTVGSVTIGSATAIALGRLRFPGRRIYESVILMPFVLPEVVTGLALLIFFTAVKIRLSLLTVVIGHIVFSLSIAHRTIAARFLSMPAHLEEASTDLGAGWFRTLTRVTLPYLGTALVASALLVFTVSFDQTVITIMVTGTENTLPMVIWSTLRRGFTPTVNAVASVVFLVSVLLVSAVTIIGRRMGSRVL
jgi:spermidine/putrescine transport system permease protein